MAIETETVDFEARAKELAHGMIVLDSHVDLPFRLGNELVDLTVRTPDGHFDGARAREGGLDAAFMAIFVPAELEGDERAQKLADLQIDMVERIAATWPDEFVVARSPTEVRDAFEKRQIALPMGMENAAPIETLDDLARYASRGISYLTLTHGANNRIGDSSFAAESRWNGLSPFGKEVIAGLNRLGIMVDVSHVTDATFDAVLAINEAPTIASHSSCRHFTPGFERNLDDDRIRRIAQSGGVIQINFGSIFLTSEAHQSFLKAWAASQEFLDRIGGDPTDPRFKEWRTTYFGENPAPAVPIATLVDHIDHAVELVGVEHVGFGSDFDGVEDLPVGLEDVSKYPTLFAELLRRGYSDDDLRLLAGENFLRVWAAIQASAHDRSG